LAASSLRAFLCKQSKADGCWLLIVWFAYVFLVLGLLSVLVFPASVFVPVHVVMRKGRLEPATIAQIF
jgi:hypothetical protein